MGEKARFDAVSILTLLVLLPLIGVSIHAYYSGAISFDEYLQQWREPALLLFGFWIRDNASTGN